MNGPHDVHFDYERYASRLLDGGRRQEVLSWKADVLSAIVPAGYAFDSALEIGCAEGIVLARLGELLHIKRCVGLDVSETFLSYGRSLYPHIDFRLTRSKTLPFPDQSIDLIILSDIIEHVQDVSLFLQEVRRVGRYILVKLPMEQHWWRKYISLPLGRAPRTGRHHPDGHLHIFTRRSFLNVIQSMGFGVITNSVRYYFNNFPYTFPNRLVKIRWTLDRFLKTHFPGWAHLVFGGMLFVFARTTGTGTRFL